MAKLAGAVVGTAIAVAGLLLAFGQYLSPLTVTTHPVSKDPFNVPFKITNTGFLSVRGGRVNCHLRSVAMAGANGTVENNTMHQSDWDIEDLGRNQSKDFVCRVFAGGGKGAATNAELVVVVDYGLSFIPLRRFRDYFRFHGEYLEQWEWQARETPAGVREEVDGYVDR